MAETLVNILLERLATIALDKVEKELKLVVGVRKELKNLTRSLEAIQAVLEDAEQRQVTETSVRRWLNELSEVSFDMDDVLDEWITEVRKRDMEKEEKQRENDALVTYRKKVQSSASSFFSFSKVKRLAHRREIAVRIKELNERLALIEKEKQRFNFQNTPRSHELPSRQKTTSFLGDKTFGRDEEKNIIVSMLLSESSYEMEVPLIIPIVGMGGIGKTTLAQLAYNDENVKSHFDKRVWVCVSDPFEEIKIAKAIVEGLEKDNPLRNSNELQTLLQCIFEMIEDKRFLLVLDDVWSPNFSQWEELIKPLRYGAKGSRVLLTSRKEEVATLMNATTQLLLLKELSEEFCLSLFFYSANMGRSESTKFQSIGLEIVKKCNGLPLAAKTLGSLMRNKRTIHEWQAVLMSKTWELKEIEQNVFRPLLLSFHDLAPAIKRCLLYCVIFPKDYAFDRDNLIKLWMSQDYLNGNRSKEAENIGQQYFNDLVTRSFFQDLEVIGVGRISCKIHDIVHDFLQYLTKNECFILDFELRVGERTDVLNDKVRHLTFMHASESESLIPILKCKSLRTLTAFDSSISSMCLELLVQLKRLRTLDLSKSHLEEIPRELGGLLHLRYLDLSYNSKVKELPDTMGSLYNLQTLRLGGCSGLQRVDLRRLINLRHLQVGGCNVKLVGIETLTNLQTLDSFNVQASNDDEGNKLDHLKELKQLQGCLSIHFEDYHPVSVEEPNLVNKDHLLHLVLGFHGYAAGKEEVRETLNALEPQPGLESLSIFDYNGNAFSDWLLSLHNLRVLTLERCWGCQLLPPLGKLMSLESLRIKHCFVSKIGVEFLGIDDGHDQSEDEAKHTLSSEFISFPKLKKLTLERFSFLGKWEGLARRSEESEEIVSENDNVTIMPCLLELSIMECEELEELPDFIWKAPLQKLDISLSPILQDLYRREEEQAKISHIPDVTLGAHDWIQGIYDMMQKLRETNSSINSS